MGVLLLTVVCGKEAKARLEALDCVFPKDPIANCSLPSYGGLLILETGLPSDDAARLVATCSTSLISKIIPVDSIIESDLEKICAEALRLTPPGSGRVAVDCARRGRLLKSSHVVEEEVGRLLKAHGKAIDLKNPDLIVRIDIIGSLSTISVRPPSGFIIKKDGLTDG
jgi:tRNA(Ser,Leu) C12 N-acetylase TAN1